MRVSASLGVAAVLVTSAADARPEPSCHEEQAATLEIAPWIAAGGGVRRAEGRTTGIGTLALDTGLTVPLHEHVRVGAWGVGGTVDFASFDVAGGVRLELQENGFVGSYSKLFGVTGRYSLLLDGGVGTRLGGVGDGPFVATRLSLGFVAPNRLYHLYQFHCACEPAPDQGPARCRPARGLVSGARPFVALARSFDGARTEVTFGLEFEAVGAGWWIGTAFY